MGRSIGGSITASWWLNLLWEGRLEASGSRLRRLDILVCPSGSILSRLLRPLVKGGEKKKELAASKLASNSFFESRKKKCSCYKQNMVIMPLLLPKSYSVRALLCPTYHNYNKEFLMHYSDLSIEWTGIAFSSFSLQIFLIFLEKIKIL